MAAKKPTLDDLALIYEQFGETVARRAFFYTQTPKDARELSDFYTYLVRDGDTLPQYDPTNWGALYRNHPANERSPFYHITNGMSKWAFDQLVAAKEFWGTWVIVFLHEVAVLKASNEMFEAIADDQGEFTKDGHRLCAWFAGWRGWGAWSDSLDAREEDALRKVLTWVFADAGTKFEHKWPNPGTPEAEALIATIKGSK